MLKSVQYCTASSSLRNNDTKHRTESLGVTKGEVAFLTITTPTVYYAVSIVVHSTRSHGIFGSTW